MPVSLHPNERRRHQSDRSLRLLGPGRRLLRKIRQIDEPVSRGGGRCNDRLLPGTGLSGTTIRGGITRLSGIGRHAISWKN